MITGFRDLRSISSRHNVIKDVRGKGLIIGVELGDDAKKFQSFALENGVLTNVSAGKVLRLIPPLIISEGSIDRFNALFQRYLAK